MVPLGALDPELLCCVVDTSASIDTCATGQESPVSVSWTIGAELGAGMGGALGFFAMPEVLGPFGAFFFAMLKFGQSGG